MVSDNTASGYSAASGSATDIFQCKKCGECCKGFGGTYVTEKDIDAIARYIHKDPETFIEDFCQKSGSKHVLAQGDNGYCIFWDELCTIHPVKPRMCRAWPFIESVIKDIKNWKMMAGSCPGICTDIPENVVKACVKNELIKTGKRDQQK
ncbi:MAG: YkgJ family cysteine cluster protein [Desulfobacterales bacterium]|nr:YkgJ family cysteine cluster protein [Desulfobacterales bacterium]